MSGIDVFIDPYSQRAKISFPDTTCGGERARVECSVLELIALRNQINERLQIGGSR